MPPKIVEQSSCISWLVHLLGWFIFAFPSAPSAFLSEAPEQLQVWDPAGHKQVRSNSTLYIITSLYWVSPFMHMFPVLCSIQEGDWCSSMLSFPSICKSTTARKTASPTNLQLNRFVYKNNKVLQQGAEVCK